ncbi:MAG: hypothetical protein FWE52_02680 [Alphaproteobacteria bacterium]|nr:hypothetical protein [Alphaproteobacteria bacterium]
METLLAIALVAAMTPFVYNRIAETSREIADIGTAKSVMAWRDKMSGYIRINHNNWPEDSIIDLDEDEFFIMAGLDPKAGWPSKFNPVAAFIEKYDGGIIDAYVSFNTAGLSQLRIAKIARTLGVDAAIADSNGLAFSAGGGWSIESETFHENDLVFRVSVHLSPDDSTVFLHRIRTGEDTILNTMERDLLMGRRSLRNVDDARAGMLDSKHVSAWFVNSESATFDDAIFQSGTVMNPTDATIQNLRVSGDITGFRSISANEFRGTGGTQSWPAQGQIIADRATITDALHVGRNLHFRAAYSGSLSGFAEISAYSVSVPYLSATNLRFGDGFGVSVSSELTFGGVPLRLGQWSFPTSPAPRFNSLVLRSAGAAQNIPEFSNVPVAEFAKILNKGWKETRGAGTQSNGEHEEE